MRVRIVQLLCPNRHAILAGIYEEGQGTLMGCIEELEDVMRELKLNPWCGICGLTALRYEDCATIFTSKAEALPELLKCQQEQIATQRITARLPGKN